MESINFNINEIENYGIEVTSVSSFIEEVNKRRADLTGGNEELFFRGQKADFWDVIPSVFREYLLSIEHTLMQLPLLKVPHEFISINNDFERMTKYQHYGMCTRLLDLTTNPLVALFFACAPYGNVCYKDDEGEVGEPQEARGIVFFNKRYSTSINEIEIKIISALSQLDLSKDNTLKVVLNKLVSQKIISKELEKRWSSQEHYEEFIDIIQNNYIVTPPYNNERLSRQSGIFLLTGCFNFTYKSSIDESIIEKGYNDLRYEFDKVFFYISGENKAAILEELDTYNINEATLFPELEHHLSYIKNKKNLLKTESSQFVKFSRSDIPDDTTKLYEEISDDMVHTESFKNEVIEILQSKYDFDIQLIWDLIVSWVSIVDWYKQESEISRFRMGLQRVLLNYGVSKNQVKSEVDDIVKSIINIAIQLSKGSE